MNQTLRISAHIISWVLHPLLVPSIVSYLLADRHANLMGTVLPASWLFVLMFLLTGVLPGMSLALLKVLGAIRSLELPDRQERLMPAIMITLLYFAVTVMFEVRYPSPSLVSLMIILTAVAATGTLLTRWWKVSLHAMCAAAASAVLMAAAMMDPTGDYMTPAISILATGAIMSARLVLDAHTVREVWTGAVAGALVAGPAMVILF